MGLGRAFGQKIGDSRYKRIDLLLRPTHRPLGLCQNDCGFVLPSTRLKYLFKFFDGKNGSIINEQQSAVYSGVGAFIHKFICLNVIP